MTYPVFQVPAGDVLPVMFSTYAGATGASVTMTGLAVTDIEIYKDGSTTQRASDAGYTLLDTDGIDFDAITGIHGFSIDTGDNTDAGFYTVGAWFTVVVSAITVDSQTVNFIACQFRLMPAESSAAVPKVDVSHLLGTAWLTPGTAGTPDVNVKLISGDATAADNLENAFDDTAGPVPWLGIVDQGTAQAASGTTVTLRAAAAFGDNTLGGCTIGVLGSTQGYWQFANILSNVGSTDVATLDSTWAVTPSGTITYKIFGGPLAPTLTPTVDVTKWGGSAVSALVSGRVDASVGAMAANVITAAATAADFTTEVQAGLATAAALDTVDNFLDTEIAAIKAVTDALPNAGALTTIQADLDDIQTRLPAALVGGRMDSNVSAIGSSTTVLTAFKRAVQGNVIGTVGAASTTTSIVTSSVTPATSVSDQLKGRILTFADDTTTAALRGQATDITASTASATPTLTVTALTTAPASGDTFTVT